MLSSINRITAKVALPATRAFSSVRLEGQQADTLTQVW